MDTYVIIALAHLPIVSLLILCRLKRKKIVQMCVALSLLFVLFCTLLYSFLCYGKEIQNTESKRTEIAFSHLCSSQFPMTLKTVSISSPYLVRTKFKRIYMQLNQLAWSKLFKNFEQFSFVC